MPPFNLQLTRFESLLLWLFSRFYFFFHSVIFLTAKFSLFCRPLGSKAHLTHIVFTVICAQKTICANTSRSKWFECHWNSFNLIFKNWIDCVNFSQRRLLILSHFFASLLRHFLCWACTKFSARKNMSSSRILIMILISWLFLTFAHC